MKLFVATQNPHKLEEILAIFSIPGLQLLDMRDYPNLPEVVEDGDSFEANARKKAIEQCAATGHWSLGDDSGLEVAALNGEPGIYSARYAGEPPDYAANNAKLLQRLERIGDRRARFRCVVALADPSGECRVVEGRCEGRIIYAPRGERGFGYDPLFMPHGYDKTFAQMDPARKNRISHRAMALAAARDAWGDLLRSAG